MREKQFKEYSNKILDLANETFSTMYYHVLKQYWHNNNTTASMARSYNATDRQNGIYETYIPTSEHMGHGLNYYRIIIKVVPELDNPTARAEGINLWKPLITPAGYSDSELIILISPKLKTRGYIRGFKHVNKPGYLTAVFIDKYKNPLVLWKKILEKLISPFIAKRLKALYDSLNFQPYQYDYIELKRHYYIWNNIIAKFSVSLGLIVKSFSHVLNWIDCKVKYVQGLIGNVAVEKEMLCHIMPMNETRRRDFLYQIKAQIEASLSIMKTKPEASEDYDQGVLLLKALEVTAHG